MLRLRHITTGKKLGAVNIEKIIVVPNGDPLADIRPDTEQEQPIQTATPSFQERTVVSSPHIVFGQYIDSLSNLSVMLLKPLKRFTVYRLPEARDILNRHGKLKGLVSKCPYLLLKGGPHGGTYLLVLDVKLFHELNK